jgi:hypothetical protein
VCHIDEGFDFLGFRIQRKSKRGSSTSWASSSTPSPLPGHPPFRQQADGMVTRRARCVVMRTPGSGSGLGKRTGRNPGTAPQVDFTRRSTPRNRLGRAAQRRRAGHTGRAPRPPWINASSTARSSMESWIWYRLDGGIGMFCQNEPPVSVATRPPVGQDRGRAQAATQVDQDQPAATPDPARPGPPAAPKKLSTASAALILASG